MPIRSGQTSNPSEYILNRSAKMRAEIIAFFEDFESQTQVRVEPDEPGKAVRIVSFTREPDDVRIECYDEETLKLCDANRYKLHCSHVQKAIETLLESTKPKEGAGK